MADIPIIHGFSIGQLFDKTILAERKVYIYHYPEAGATAIGYVMPGNAIGVLYSYLAPDFSKNRDRYWLMFYGPVDGVTDAYYVPFNDADFDWSSIQQQGAITVLQQQAQKEQQEKEENTPWYEKLANWVGDFTKGDIVQPVIKTGLIVGGLYVGAVFILPAVLKALDERKAKKK